VLDFHPGPLNSQLMTNDQLILVRVPGLPARKTVSSFLPLVLDDSVRSFDEISVVLPSEVRIAASNRVGRIGSGPVLSVPAITNDGDCGALYVGRIGKSWFIRAMHYMLLNAGIGESVSVGAMVTQREVTLKCAALGSVLQGVYSPPSQFAKDCVVAFSPLPNKSESALAISRGADIRPLGEM